MRQQRGLRTQKHDHEWSRAGICIETIRCVEGDDIEHLNEKIYPNGRVGRWRSFMSKQRNIAPRVTYSRRSLKALSRRISRARHLRAIRAELARDVWIPASPHQEMKKPLTDMPSDQSSLLIYVLHTLTISCEYV